MGVSEPTEGGGRKSVDVAINLVPFIDMMSVMVAFLLITAVWSNLSRIDVKERGIARTTDKDPPPEARALSILVAREAVWVGAGDVRRQIPGRDWGAVQTTVAEVARVAALGDDAPVEVAAEDRVQYQEVVSAMDAAISAGHSSVGYADPQGLSTRFRQ